MKLSNHLLEGAFALCALLPIGCTSGSSGTTSADTAGSDPVEGAINEVLRDLSAKMAERSAAGWPAHVQLSSALPPRPVLEIGRIMNNTRESLDMKDFERRLTQALVEQGVVHVAAPRPEREDAVDGRAPGDETGEAGESAGLTLTGWFEDDVLEVNGHRTHKVVVRVRVVDTRKGGPLVIAAGEATSVTERS